MLGRTGWRLMRATRTALWKNEAVKIKDAPEKAKDATQSASAQAAALRHIDFREMPKLVESLVNQREMQAFLSDAYSPYDQLDPVLLSALLREDLAGVVEKCGATEEEFLADYREARGLHTTTRENRAAFKKKYRFDPFQVTYREEEFVLSEKDLKALKTQLMTFNPEKSPFHKEYQHWESQLNEMFNSGYTRSDHADLKRWLDTPRAFDAVILHSFNMLSVVYRLALYTGRIDGVAADRMFSPRYLPTRQEVVDAFRLDIPGPEKWRFTKHNEGVELARRVEDYNRDFSGIFHNMSFATFIAHFMDTHMSALPLKFHCKATATLLIPTQEYINSLAEYLVKRAKTYQASDVPILEVGAGTGRLSFLLNETEAFKEAGLKSIATDIQPLMNPFMVGYGRSERHRFQAFEVETINENDAVEKYQSAIILCQMMPNGVDWPAGWRKHKSLCEYVLVGPSDGIACGRPWDTWGVVWGDQLKVKFLPSFVADGFKKVYIDDVSRHVLGQDEHPQCHSQNRCVSFRRMTAIERVARSGILFIQPFMFVGFFTGLAYYTLPAE